MNKLVKGIFRFLIQIAVIVILIVVVNVFINGMYLLGLPNLSDIQSASISYPSVTEDIKEVSSPEDIELALKLTGFLKYNLLFPGAKQLFINNTYRNSQELIDKAGEFIMQNPLQIKKNLI